MTEATGILCNSSARRLLRVADEHDAALAEFYRATWNPHATAEVVHRARHSAAAANPVSPGEESPTFILLQHSRVIGYIGTIPVRVWSDNTERPAHWMKGLTVLPEYRNGPAGFLLLREALRHLSCSMALAVLPVVIGLSVRLGFSDLGTLPNFVRVLRPAKLAYRLRLEEVGFARLPAWLRKSAALSQRAGLASATGFCAGGLLGVAAALRGRHPRSLTIDIGIPDSTEIDSLWMRTRTTLAAGLVRDSRYLTWRYPPGDSDQYHYVSVRKGRDLAALAIVRRPRAEGDPRLHGATVATLSEWIFPLSEPATGLAALAGAERVARHLGADALLCSASHPRAHELLRRRSYLRAPPNVHLLIRDPANAGHLPVDISNWWITRGDSNADEVF
jgi:predicted N-acetyltransferase YhbS